MRKFWKFDKKKIENSLVMDWRVWPGQDEKGDGLEIGQRTN